WKEFRVRERPVVAGQGSFGGSRTIADAADARRGRSPSPTTKIASVFCSRYGVHASVSVFLHPGYIPVHPVLQKTLARCADISAFIEQTFPDLNERFRLPQCRHIQVGENIAQMLLRYGRADGAD